MVSALGHIASALQAKADDGAILADFGLVQASLNDLDGALATYDLALILRPNLAETHCRRGDALRRLMRPADALDSYDRATELYPDFAQALNNRGLALIELGRPLEALASYERALAAQPDYGLALCNRGRALQDLGRLDEALQAYDLTLAKHPDHVAALNNRGVLLQTIGRLDAALADLDRAVGVQPAHVEALNNRGNLLRVLGRSDAALASYDRVLTIDPGHRLALINRGDLLRDLGRSDEALASYDAALALDPDRLEALINRSGLLLMLGRADEALANLERAVSVDPQEAKALNLRGLALLSRNRPTEALASYDRALELDPDFADALGNRGMLLAELGRFDEARAAIERSLALAPRSVRGYYNLTVSMKLAAGDPHLKAMQDLAEDIDALSLDEQIHLRFALAKALGDIGDHARSFPHLLAGAALKRQAITYDEAASLAELRRIQSVFSEDVLRDVTGSGDPSPAPVFILGMPRSGTSLVEQILASHPKVAAAGETDDLRQALGSINADGALAFEAIGDSPPAQWRRIGQDYLRQISAFGADAARITNKTTENFRLIGFIRLALPQAKIIHVQRDPIDTCLSCFTKLFGGDLPFTYDLAELGRYHRAYETLMAHWREVVPPQVMLEVRYEDIVADLHGQARRIVSHCGLDWDPRCIDFHLTERWVHTASATQVRQPIFRSSIGRWRSQQAFLQPLIDALHA